MRHQTKRRILTNSQRRALLPKTPEAIITEYEIWIYQILSSWHRKLHVDVKKAAVEDGYRNDALLGYLWTLLAQFSLKVQEIFTAKNLQAPLARYAAQVANQNLKTQ